MILPPLHINPDEESAFALERAEVLCVDDARYANLVKLDDIVCAVNVESVQLVFRSSYLDMIREYLRPSVGALLLHVCGKQVYIVDEGRDIVVSPSKLKAPINK